MAGGDHLINGAPGILVTVDLTTPPKGRCSGHAGSLRQEPGVHPTEGVSRESPSSSHPGEDEGKVVGAEGGAEGIQTAALAMQTGAAPAEA